MLVFRRTPQIGSLNASFDLAGNMTGDGTHTYEWDAEDRMVSIDGGSTATYKYNALGQRVERFLPNGSWTFDYLFSAAGEELGLYSAGTAAWFDQDVPMGGRLLVLYGSPLRILHANKLGSTTVVTDQTGAELEDQVAYPWGQTWTTAGLGYDRHFAGMKQFESPEQLYPTDFRKYNAALGRWMTPDPAGMAAADPSNPQSWNRYAYVLNNPVSNIDPSGLFIAAPDDGLSVDNVGVLPPGASAVPGGGGSSGGGGGGAARNSSPPDISKTWSKTFSCTESATQLMSDVQNDFGAFASNPLGPFIAKFPDQPLKMGNSYDIYAGLFMFNDAGPVYLNDLRVKVTAQIPKAWVFTTDPAHHVFNGTIAFIAADAGNGNVSFSITASADFTSWLNKYILGSALRAGEDSTWTNLLNNVQRHCSAGGAQ